MALRIPSRTNFKILREHRDWLVVEKPAPLLIHPAKRRDEVTLLGLLSRERPSEVFFFVNRLDRETSGCVLVARSPVAARALGKMMARREIQKGYLAIVRGIPEWKEKRVELGLRRKGEFTESKIWVRQAVHPGGKRSVTSFSVKGFWIGKRGPFSLVSCIPETGRTHQIRAHLEWLGHGIVGDKIYGGDEEAYLDFLRDGWTEGLGLRLLCERQALHAGRLEFSWKGRREIAECGLPDDLSQFRID